MFRLQPFKQMPLKKLNKDNKLAPMYYGPYKMFQKIGSMTYKLYLPASSGVHPVFHVSFLKVIGDKIPIHSIFPDLDEEVKIILEPKKIFETRTKQLQTWVIIEYLIKRKNLQVEYLTWEDESFIQKHPQLTKH